MSTAAANQPAAPGAPLPTNSNSLGNLTKASNRLYDIPALEDDGGNFPSWKFRTQMVLEVRDLWSIVKTDAAPPSEASSGRVLWEMKDREARAQIALTLKDEPLNSVLFAKTAKESWDLLNTRYKGKGKQKIAYLISDLFRGTLTNDSPLEPQINTM